MTAEDYLRWEATQLEKHEFVAGQVRELGAVEIWPDLTAEHELVVRRLGALLGNGLDTAAFTVEVRSEGDMTAPDIVVLCGGQYLLAIDVMPPQDGFRDHRAIFLKCCNQPEVLEIVQIALAQRRGDSYQRHVSRANQWLVRSFDAGDTVVLSSINLQINVDDLFEGLGPAPAPRYLPAAAAT